MAAAGWWRFCLEKGSRSALLSLFQVLASCGMGLALKRSRGRMVFTCRAIDGRTEAGDRGIFATICSACRTSAEGLRPTRAPTCA